MTRRPSTPLDRVTGGALVALVGLLCFALATPAIAAPQDDPVERKLESMERRIRELEVEKQAREREAGAQDAESAPPVAAAAQEKQEEGAAPAPAEEYEKRTREASRAKAIYLRSMNDRQSAAARITAATLDPEYRGFIPVPNTAVMVKLNARPRVDLIGDTENTGTEFRFVPALFPEDDDRGWRMSANANGSQLVMDVRAPDLEGAPRFYYQNDFFGSNDSPMRYRLQHLYGEYDGFLAGFTYGVFEDPDAWPETVDYEGPNSVIFARGPWPSTCSSSRTAGS